MAKRVDYIPMAHWDAAYAHAEPAVTSPAKVVRDDEHPEWTSYFEIFSYEVDGEEFEAVMEWNNVNGKEAIWGFAEIDL